jgi:hypothetical protein
VKAYTAEWLYGLLPSIYRLRDRERGEPLRALLAVLGEQASLVEQDIGRLYENWFIETCDESLVPYIGDLLSVRGLHQVSQATFSHRARVANTIGYRRRKGTASMLEQLARDTTGWPARVVEYFQRLATTQYLSHLRPQNHRTPDLRRVGDLNLLGTPFDRVAHTADVRHVDVNRGRHNVMNVGIFLWRLQAFPIVGAPPFAHGNGRFSFSQLGHDIPLFNHPLTEIDPSHLADELNLPVPIRRAGLAESLDAYVGTDRSLMVTVGGVARKLVACNLSGWVHRPATGTVAVDPMLGRLAFAADDTHDPDQVRVTYHYGFSGEVGGGCYERPQKVPARYIVGHAGQTLTSLHAAIASWLEDGQEDAVVEIADNAVYRETISISIPSGTSLRIRAANRCRPTIHLSGPLVVTGQKPADGQLGGHFALEGLLIAGHPIEIGEGHLAGLEVSHCTLVPGLALDAAGQPAAPQQASLIAARNPGLDATLSRTICGRLSLRQVRSLRATDSVIDGHGGIAIETSTLRVEASTVIGSVATRVIEEASNSIFTASVMVERNQEGCVRFCFLPWKSIVPRRFHCQPDLAIERALEDVQSVNPLLSSARRQAIRDGILLAIRPRFTESRYGQPGYGQLSPQCPAEIRTGAEDQAEMGVFHHLQQPQRDANLRASVNEYLRVGLEVGLFYVT